MSDLMIPPEYAAQAELAHSDLMETVKRFEREGFDSRAVLAAMTGALATVVSTLHGAPEVPAWFARAAAESMHLATRPAA